jgi:hypothetical protein
VDEAQHAVIGLFVANALRDLPIRHPVHYAYRYYAQYPALAILGWPPLFYIFEGLSFLVLGRFRQVHRAAFLCPATLSRGWVDHSNVPGRSDESCDAGCSGVVDCDSGDSGMALPEAVYRRV